MVIHRLKVLVNRVLGKTLGPKRDEGTGCAEGCITTSFMICTYQIQGVPLATEPCISLIILTQMKKLQRNLNRSTFVV
jgi:hypothetical protein